MNGSSVLVNDIGIPLPTTVLTYGPTADATLYTAGAAGTTDAGATITLLANGTFTYTPVTGFSGIDQFKYITGNGNLPNNDAIVSITVGADISFTTTNVDPLCNGGSNGSITINASGGNGTLTYSITGAGGTYFASNVFTGLAAGTYNLAVKDAGGYIKTGTATLNNPASIVVSGTIAALTYNTAMATATFTKTGGTGTIAWSATGLPAGVGINASTGDVTGTPTVTGSFSAVITATDANGCTGTKSVTVTAAPKLTNDAYAVVGNTQLVANGHSAPATPFTANAANVLTNDASNAAITVTAGTFATTNGGSITIDAAGKFTYTPLNGSLTADSYTYTGTSNGIAATATINFTVAAMIWYVNNTYAGANGAANGSSHRPYTDVASAEAVSANTQVIYVHTGSGNTTGNALLKGGQILRGAGSALSVGALSIAAGTKPTLTGMVTLASSVTVDGFDMTTGATTAITSTAATNVTVSVGNITTSGAVNAVTLTGTTGSVTIAGGTQTGSTGPTFNIAGGTVSLTYSGSITQAANAPMVSVSGGHATGTVLFQTGTLSATNGTGLHFDNADGTYNFNGTTTLNGGDAGIDILNASSGTFSFGSGTAITNPANEAIKINAGTANVTYSGTFSKTNNTVNGILINGETGGTININGTGTKTLSNATGNTVNLTTNTGATINFSGNNLLLTTTSGTGFNATGGGTISVAGTGNTITSLSGTALNVVNTTIGATGLTFQSISSAGSAASIGIILNNTGSSGGLTVTGTGSAGSGGTIANKTGTDLSVTNGIGIYLNGTSGVSLSRMQINDCQNFGIRGTSVTGFSLINSTVNGTNGTTNTGGNEEGSIRFDGLFTSAGFPTVAITGCTIAGGYTQNVYVKNTSGTLDRLTMTNNTFGLIGTVGGNDNVDVAVQLTGTLKVTCNDNQFLGSRSDFFEAIADNNSTLDVVCRQNKFTNGQAIIPGGGVAVSIRSGSGGLNSSATTTYDVSCNRHTSGGANAYDVVGIFIAKGQDLGSMQGTINNNILGPAKVGSNSDGIFVRSAGNGTCTVLIKNNTITGWGNVGIHLQNNDGNCTMNASIFGNSVTAPGSTFPFSALFVDNGATATDACTANVVLGSASVPGDQNTLVGGANAAVDVGLSNFNASTHFNFSKNGSVSSTPAGIVADDNVGTPSEDHSGGVGTITLVTTLPATPPAVSLACAVPAKVTFDEGTTKKK